MFLSYLVCVPSLKSINSSSLSRKKYGGGNFSPPPRQRLQGQSTSVGIGLTELTEPSDTLNYKLFFKHCILQTVLHGFYCLYLCGTKSFVLKPEPYFTFFFDLVWGGIQCYSLKVLRFWCSLYKITANQRFFSYNRYNLLGIKFVSNKNSPLRNVHQYISLTPWQTFY